MVDRGKKKKERTEQILCISPVTGTEALTSTMRALLLLLKPLIYIHVINPKQCFPSQHMSIHVLTSGHGCSKVLGKCMLMANMHTEPQV